MKLSEAQARFFRESGYLQIPEMVDRQLIVRARRAINISVGQGMDKAEMPRLRVRSFCPELREAPALMDLLLESGIWQLGQSLLGHGQVRPGSQGAAQINLRFPVERGPQIPLEPHLDGMASKSNSVPAGQLHSFTALIGVMLNDMPYTDAGNFAVWPGSHLLNETYLRQAGPKSLLEGMPDVALGEPVQITGRTGDVVLSHYLLSHGTASNWSSEIRYMVFFRLTHIDHDRHKWTSLTNLWLQWPGLRERGAARC